MHDLQHDTSLLGDMPAPAGLHQHLANQLFLAQMSDQSRRSIRRDDREVQIERPQRDLVHELDMMRKGRRQIDQVVFEQEDADREEPYGPEVLRFVDQHVENVPGLSCQHGNAPPEAVPDRKSGDHEDTQGYPHDREPVARAVRKADDERADRCHQRVVDEVLSPVEDPRRFDAIQLVEILGVDFLHMHSW